VGHTSSSTSLLHVEASRGRVSWSGLKTGGGTTTCGARDTIVEVHEDQVEDRRVDATGCIGSFYPKIVVFYVLGARGILVF
jgi:hypothetical protein